MSNSLCPHELQHARPPCPSPSPGVHSNSCPVIREMQIDIQLFDIDTYFQQSLLRGLFFFKLLLNISLCILIDIQNTADRKNFWRLIVHSAYVLWKNIKSSLCSVQSLSHVLLFATPWTTAHQAFLSITNSRSLLKFMCMESVMPSNHLILFSCLLSFLAGSFQISSFSRQVAKVLEFQLQHQSFQWIFRTDFL